MEINFNSIKKILIIQYQPFGDVLLNTGYLPFLRKRFPNAKIDFLVRKPFHVVLEGNPYIDELITFVNNKGLKYYIDRAKLEYQLYRKKYDLVIDQIRNSGSALLTFFCAAKYRLGWDDIRWRSIYNIRVSKTNIRYYSSLKFDLVAPLGITEEPHELYFHIKQESLQYIDKWLEDKELKFYKLICFSPGSPIQQKKWNLENYAKLADLILENTDYKVILLWGPREEEDVNTVSELMKKNAIIALPTDFNQAAAMLKKSALLICNDGGINHLAVAVKIPSLSFFGITNPLKWCATNLGKHYYLYNSDVDSKKDNTFGITAEMAFLKVKEILEI